MKKLNQFINEYINKKKKEKTKNREIKSKKKKNNI